MTDLYETLGVESDATDAEIRKAYKKKAQQNHPDREGGDVDQFKQVAHAYAVLNDADRRKRYDETGSDDNSAAQGAENVIMECFSSAIDQDVPGDIVKAIKDHIRKREAEFKSSKSRLEKKLAKLERHQGRVISKGRNLYDLVINQKIAGLNQGIQQETDKIDLVSDALTLLEAYTDSAPEEEEIFRPPFGTDSIFNFRTSTTA